MIRALRFAAIALAAFAALLAVNSWLHQHGFIAASVMHDWGEVVLYGDGKGSYREFTTTYPPIAFALGVLAGVPIRQISSLPPPVVTAALLAALLAATWTSALRAAGYGRWCSVVLTVLICLHPFFLYIATTGVDAILLLIAVYWFAAAYCASRIKGRVTDLMNLALALAFTAFVHPLGALICVVALPFLALALPPALIARSALNSMLVLLFPLLFALGSFAYENALFEDSATAFLRNLFGHVPAVVRAGQGFAVPHSDPLAWCIVIGVAVLTLAAAVPIALVPLLRRPQGRGLARPIPALFALASVAVASVGIEAVTNGGTANPSALLKMAAPFVALAAVAVRHWPSSPRCRGAVAALLLAGVVLSWGVSFLWRSGEPALWRDAAMGVSVDVGQNTGAATLGRYLATRTDILIDASAHPEVLASRGSAYGLVVPTDDAFMLATLTRQIHTHFIAVPDPDFPEMLNDDLLTRTFAKMYEQGMRGYHLIYDTNGWRVYERNDARNPV
ncbi:hypothetical protein PQR37_37325 [Paraburkholderia nemoris]|uniref:hypothetical protein n=1 Tax=Paraburkholderia nemoris TaxID=2793076 RepID=UPI0038B84D23